MSNISFPSTVPASSSWGYQRNIAYNRSMGGLVTRVALTGDRWVCSMTLPPVTGEAARLLRSFAMRVSEAGNSASLQDHSYTFSGASSLTPLVNGASQTGSTLAIDGLTPNITGIIKAGDRLGLTTNQVVEASADADTNGSGETTVSLTTPLRSSPDTDSAVELYTPTALFLFPDAFVEWAVSAPLLHRMTFQFIEDI